MPLFSIVMPTRNRGALLRSSLETAINQTFSDYEIIVCDNNSTDDTRKIVEAAQARSNRITYVNPTEDLSMCDNWDFAFSHARGEFIAYLSDDDGLLPDCLTYAYGLISKFKLKLLVWPHAYYQHPDIPDPKCQAMLSCDFMSGRLFEVASDAIIKALCDFQPEDIIPIIPRMHNGVVERTLVEKAARATNRFFVPPFPDYTTACQMLCALESYHFIDLPLGISGASLNSNTGLRFDRKGKFVAYTSMYPGDLLADVPAPMRYLTAPYLHATYKFFQRTHPDKFHYPVNMDTYYEAMCAELAAYEDYDDVSGEYQQLKSYMREYYGSDDKFESLWQKNLQARRTESQRANSSRRLLIEKFRKNKTLFRYAKKVKDFVAPPRPAYLEFANVPSIDDAARLLLEKLPLLAPQHANLHPEPANSSLFLRDLRIADQHAS
jgi:glycosyltransferase involved in cell wall biosynthesis